MTPFQIIVYILLIIACLFLAVYSSVQIKTTVNNQNQKKKSLQPKQYNLRILEFSGYILLAIGFMIFLLIQLITRI